MIGCLLAVALRARFAPGLWERVCGNACFSAITAALIVGSDLVEFYYGTSYRDTVGGIVNPVLVAILIAQLIAFRATLLWRWLNWGWVRYLGRISYSVYLYQQLVMQPASKLVGRFGILAELAASVASVALFASASYYIVERPFLKLKNRFQAKARVRTVI